MSQGEFTDEGAGGLRSSAAPASPERLSRHSAAIGGKPIVWKWWVLAAAVSLGIWVAIVGLVV
ncbi:hypothetical protein [Novosphingobium panipatense]|uniref:hypothetical protein n=1 Tax=Novosphingobium panipatense TaxID=428991 RepID=UPI00360FD6C7